MTGPLAWLGAVAAATAVGLAAIGAIGVGIVGAGPAVLTPAQVDTALAAAGPPPSAPSPPTPSTPADQVRVVDTAGGLVSARCAGRAVEIVSVSPAQGYRTDDDDEPGRVEFESADRKVEVRESCAGGRLTEEIRDDD